MRGTCAPRVYIYKNGWDPTHTLNSQGDIFFNVQLERVKTRTTSFRGFELPNCDFLFRGRCDVAKVMFSTRQPVREAGRQAPSQSVTK